MAVRIPSAQELGFADPRPAGRLPQYPGEDPGALAGAQLGKGLQAAGGALIGIDEERRRKQNQVNEALATADLEGNLIRTKEALKVERDPEKIEALKGQLSGFMDRAGASFTDPEARQLWALKHRKSVVEAEAVANDQHRKVYNDHFLANSTRQLDEQTRLAAQASDPADRETAKRNIGNIIGSMEQAGIINAAKASELALGYGQDVIVGHANWLAANGRAAEASMFLQSNGRAVDPTKLRQLNDYLKPRTDKEAALAAVDGTAPGADVDGPAGVPRRGDPRGMEGFIRATAIKYGHDPDTAVKVARSEGLGQFYGDGGKSGTAFQLFTGGGLGNEFQKETGLDPLDPKNERKAIDWALKNLDRTGWAPYHGAKKVGVGPRQGIGVGAPRATEEELDAAPVAGGAIPLEGPKRTDYRAWVDRIDAHPGLSAEQKDIAKAEVRRRHSEESLGQAEAASDLTLAIGRGQKGREDIEAEYDANRISPEKRTALHHYLDEIDKKRAADAEGLARVGAAGNGGPPLDPKTKADRDALNFHFGIVSKAWPADQVIDRSVNYAVQYGLVPEPLQKMIRSGLHSGRADQAVLAANTVARLRNANPQLVGEIGDENDMRLATLVERYAAAGMPAEEAVRRASEGLKVNKAEREARDQVFTEERNRNKDEAWLANKQNWTFLDDPNTVDPVMIKEFEELSRVEYQLTGDLESARQLALANINRVWGRTEVGGEFRYMKQAPEKFYGIPSLSASDNSKWMNEQLLDDVKPSLPAEDKVAKSDRLRIVLAPPGLRAGGAPEYFVLLVKQDGTWDRLEAANGQPVRWRPDWARSAEYGRRQAAIGQMRQDRERVATESPSPSTVQQEMEERRRRRP